MNGNPRRDLGSLTAADLARLDAAAVECGVDVLQLMEVAGLQVARVAWAMLGERPGDVLVVAGRGNNGGDGLVAARHLDAWGCTVEAVLIAEPDAVHGAAATQLRAATGCGIHVVVTTDANEVARAMRADGLTIDALLGTGLRSAPRERDAEVIEAMGGAPVLAVDVPSGLDATTGEAPGACVTARATCTLTAMKSGLWTAGARARTGDITVADIGMPSSAWRAAGLAAPRLVRAAALLPVPAVTP